MPEYEKARGSASFLQVYFVGISMVMASHCALWTLGLLEGFWEYFLSIMIVSVGFLSLALCLSEMISILPFGGGAYGFARVTMGPFLGFMVGFFDSLANIIYVSLFIRVFVLIFIFCAYITVEEKLLPYTWLLCYVGLVSVHTFLGKFNFWFMAIMGLVVLAVPIIFIAGTAHNMNYQVWVVDQQKLWMHVWMQVGARGFMKFLPVSALFYFGFDMLVLVCEDTKDATVTVPRALMAVFITMFVLAIAVLFAVSCQYPGAFISGFVSFPFTFGFVDLFHTTSYQRITISLIPCFAMEIYTLTYAFGRQMCALSRSKLLPAIFSWTSSGNVPYMSLILGSVLGMLNLVVLDYIDQEQFVVRIGLMYTVAQLCSIFVYVISLLSYIVFRFKYGVLNRPFNVGVLGVPLATIGVMIFLTLGISLCFFNNDNHFHLKAFAILSSFGTAYYFLYARSRQSFSQEEQSILFAVYVIKANSKHRTWYHWFERKYNRYVLHNVSTTNLVIRTTSWRKNSGSVKTKKVTPLSDKRARANHQLEVVPEEVVVKSSRVVLAPIESSGVHNNISSGSGPVTDDMKRSNSSRELEIELGEMPYTPVVGSNAPLSMIRLPPLDHHHAAPHSAQTHGDVNLLDKSMLDADLDRPFDAPTKQKKGNVHAKAELSVEGAASSSEIISEIQQG